MIFIEIFVSGWGMLTSCIQYSNTLCSVGLLKYMNLLYSISEKDEHEGAWVGSCILCVQCVCVCECVHAHMSACVV